MDNRITRHICTNRQEQVQFATSKGSHLDSSATIQGRQRTVYGLLRIDTPFANRPAKMLYLPIIEGGK